MRAGGYRKISTDLWVPVAKRAKEKVRHKTSPLGVADGARTRDTQDHNLVLYQLNYNHHHCLQAVRTMLTQKPTIVKTAGSMGCVQEKRARHAAPIRVTSGNRTRDTQDHNLVLYLLSYNHHSHHVGGTFQGITRNYGCKYSWYRSIAAACADPHAGVRGFATNNTRR